MEADDFELRAGRELNVSILNSVAELEDVLEAAAKYELNGIVMKELAGTILLAARVEFPP